MVSVCIRKDMEELQAFLRDAYARGHPRDKDVECLDTALGIIAANKTTAEALAAVKTALSEGSWFRTVPLEHQDDAEFERAMALCVSISRDLEWMTCGSYAAPVPGKWEALPVIGFGDDPDSNPIFDELDKCGVVRQSLERYVMFVEYRLPVGSASRQLPRDCQVEVGKLKEMIKKCPQGRDLLSMEFRTGVQRIAWSYQTSYFASGGNEFCRSALLAALPEVMAQLDKCEEMCRTAFPHTFVDVHTQMYQSCKDNYAAWQALAEPQLRQSVGMAQLRAREQGGGKHLGHAGSMPEMRGLLRRMQSLQLRTNL